MRYSTCAVMIAVLGFGLAGLLPAAELPPDRGGLGMEIRYEPIPGVPLRPARQAPVPVGPPELQPAGEFRPVDGTGRTAGEDAAVSGHPVEVEMGPQACAAGVDCRTQAVQCRATAADHPVPRLGCRMTAEAEVEAGDGPPNLTFYKPTGWDYPIVPSNVRNTRTVGPDLNDRDTTFFDFAVINNGSSVAKPRFYTYLYWDGRVFAGFYTESLPAGYYTYYNDYPFLVPAGAHLIAGFTDSTNVVAESLETDNRWSRSYTWRSTGQVLPNLRPYAPSGWDFPVVPSNVRGTHTVGPDLNDLDTTFIDWAVLNDANISARPRFYIYMYLDSRVIGGWYVDSLLPYYYVYADDDWNFVQAGTRTLGLFADSTNTVAESNEDDNRYSRAFTWRHDPSTLPNLTYYLPDTSWDYPLVPSSVRGTHKEGPDLNDRDTTFVDWCIANLGNYVARPAFYVYLYHDAVPLAGWHLESLPARTYTWVGDYPRIFPSGSHLLGMFIDSTNAVNESNEADNRYSRSFVWQHVPIPDLAPYAPGGWDYPVVPSNVRNTHSVGPDLNDLDTTFIDWAVANFGSATAKPTFYTYLYEDGTPFAGWYAESLPPGYYVSVSDYPRMIAQGNHTLRLFTDSTDAVAESLETNNSFERSFSWRHQAPAMPNLTYYQPSGWDYPIVPSNVRNTHSVGPDLNDRDTTFTDLAFANNGRATAKPRFYTYLYADGTPFAGLYMESLPAGFYGYAEDVARLFTAGDHLLAMFVDSTNAVAESVETDNRWERSFNWRPFVGMEESREPGIGARQLRVASVVRDMAAVRFELPSPGECRLAVYDVLGRQLAVLCRGPHAAGSHVAYWDCARRAAGTYLVVLEGRAGERQVAALAKP